MAQRDRSWAAAVLAALAVTLLGAVYIAAVWTPTGQLLDHALMREVSGLAGVDKPTAGTLSQVQFQAFAVVGLIAAGVVALRRSAHVALDAVATAVFGIVGSVMLKAALPRPDLGVGSVLNSFPSSTVTVFAVAAVICAMAARPGLVRAAAFAVTLGLGGAASIAVVMLQWHRPSDVIGAWLVAIAGGAVSRAVSGPVAPARAGRGRAPRQPQRGWSDQLSDSSRFTPSR